MTVQRSYTKIEKGFLQDLRKRLMRSETTEDVKKDFAQVVQGLVAEATGGSVRPAFEDVQLLPGEEDGYALGDDLLSSEGFNSVWSDSDLPRIVRRLADISAARCRRLKQPDRTGLRIVPTPDSEGR
jgi:hypothetical protein